MGSPEHKLGELTLSVRYLKEKAVVEVTIVSAKNLPGLNRNGKVWWLMLKLFCSISKDMLVLNLNVEVFGGMSKVNGDLRFLANAFQCTNNIKMLCVCASLLPVWFANLCACDQTGILCRLQ